MLKSAVLVLFAAYLAFDILVSANKEQDALLTPCWRCICEATSGCNTTIGCEQGFCGPFKLSWTYWKEAGKPTVKGDDPEAEEAYNNCVNDIYCAIVSVQRYTNKHAQDCNNDNIVDCDDYAFIHKLGPFACKSIVKPEDFVGRYEQCKTKNGPLTV